MKINIPSEIENTINLEYITPQNNGIIICHYKNKPTGFICFDGISGSWTYFNSINIEDTDYYNDILLDLVNRLIKDTIADSFDYVNFDGN